MFVNLLLIKNLQITMKNRKKRNVSTQSFQHVYKISVDGGVVFYRTVDHLVYYTIESVMSMRYRIPVLVRCQMFNHTHKLCAPVDPQQLAACESNINIAFTREYNKEYGRTGRLFRGPFGSAPKWTDKDRKSALLYILNNPVEKKLCRRAVEDRWTFLAYYQLDYPFSEKPVLSKARWALRNAMKVVESEYRGGRYLRYALLNRLFGTLTGEEQEQLTDYIIQLYFRFDRGACCQLFESLQQMAEAADVSKGKEFDVGEEFDPTSDVPYREMGRIALRYNVSGPGLFNLSDRRRERLAAYFRQHTMASEEQIARYLHGERER